MTTIKADDWSKLNIWREADGDLVVRPGLREQLSPDEDIVGGFSIQLDTSGEMFHFLATDDGGAIHLHIFDESYVEFQDFVWSVTSVDVPNVTYGLVQGQMLICCPTLPTLFCMAGSGVCFAAAVSSDNSATTALTEVPRGIATNICNRVVIADGRTIYVSDPIGLDGGDVRTFVGVNVNQRPGPVFGLHEGAGGMLVTVTSVGTYGLDSDAFAVQVVGMNGSSWRLLSHVTAHSHRSSCTYRGRVLALTAAGFTYADTPAAEEVFIGDPTMPRARGPQIAMADFRACRMFGTPDGPLIACAEMSAFFRADLQTGVMSWWRDQSDAPGDVRAVLTDRNGSEMLGLAQIVYAVLGDFDGVQAITSADSVAQPYGTLLGVLPAPAIHNLLPRHVFHAAAIDGANVVAIAVRGSEHSATAPTDPHALAVNSTWGDTDLRYLTTPMVGVRISFGDISDMVASRDVGIEISTQGCLTRINSKPEIEFAESAKYRPNASG